MTILRWPAWPLMAVLAWGCERAPPPVVGEVGEPRVIENARLPEASGVSWSLAATPDLTLGGREGAGAHHLFRVRDVVPLPGGRIAVADGGSGEIRVFGPDAAHLASMGRPGDGPGEFRRLTSLAAWPGDSIVAWDPRHQRISVFHSGGRFGRTVQVPHFNDSFGLEFLGVTPDHRFFFRAGFPQRGDAPYRGMFRPDQTYALVTSEGVVSADLGAHPGAEGFLAAGGGFESFYGHPHAKSTLATVWGDRLLITPNDAFELRAFTSDGMPDVVIRLDREPMRPTRDDMLRWFEEFTADDAPAERAAFRRTFEEFPLLESAPAFDALLVDAVDHIWVRDFTGVAGGPARWVVFNPEGVVLGTLDTPSGLEVHAVGADFVLGVARDEFDVERVQRWPLTRR